MKGPSSHLHVLILGLALAAFVSCKGGEKAAQTSASESKPAPAPAPAAAATATTTAEATTAEPKNKVAPAEAVDATVKAVVDTGQKGPSGEAALLGKPVPAAKGPAIPVGATAECNDSSYSMSHDKSMTCKGHSGVRHWLKP
jgi:Protein of unknown function (DUF3761)